MLLVQREQPVLIGRETEEVTLLFDPFDRRALRTTAHIVLAKGGLLLGVISLVAHRIPAGIAVEIDVAVRLHPLPDFLAGAMMLFFGGANETIEGDVQPLVHFLETLRIACRDVEWRQLFSFRGLDHLRSEEHTSELQS